MQAAKGQCKGATRTRKRQGARDREDYIGGAARRELWKLGVGAGTGWRRLAAQWASVAMPRPVWLAGACCCTNDAEAAISVFFTWPRLGVWILGWW
jgi:hypothetical protein